MALDIRQNILSAQYLENKLTDFHQILYMHSYWQDLSWDCYKSFFVHLYQSYSLWFTPKLCFRTLSWEQNDRISPNFYICIHSDKIYIRIVAYHFFHIWTRVMAPWFLPIFWFCSISWEPLDRISPNFIYAFIFTRSSLGLLHIIFRTFVPM